MATGFATTQVKPGPQGHAALVLDGVKCGLIGDLSGGGISAQVVQEQMNPGNVAKKHLGDLIYEEFSLQIGFAMGKPVFQWIADAWMNTSPRKSGSVVACDARLEAQSERKFLDALITATTIPTLDVSSKEAAWLTLKFAPESIQQGKASGKVSASDPKHPEKLLLPANFKLEIDGLECGKVARIDSFTVKQPVIRDEVGDDHTKALEPGGIEFPNLAITFSEVHEPSWAAWFEDFVIQGHHEDDKEKNGKLTLLSPDRKQALAAIQFFNLGIYKIGHDHAGSGSNRVKLAKAELYCERMEFHPG